MPSTTFMVFFDQTAVLEQDHGETTCRFVIPKNNSEDLPRYHDCPASAVLALLATDIETLA